MYHMKFTTSISSVNDGNEVVRGHKLPELMRTKTFTEVIFLVIKGALPNATETTMFNSILSSMVDHGPGTASGLAARIVQAAGNELHTAVGAGILALGGTRHGGALGGAAEFFQQNINTKDLPGLLKDLKAKKIRVSGFGHKVLTHDNRTDSLFAVAQETGFYGKHCAFALKVGEELNKISSKPLPLNMDGANAAILSDMGFPADLITGLFLIARTPGLVAQAYEEMHSGAGIRRLDESDIEYTG